MYKISRDAIFEISMINLPSVKFHPWNFIGKTLACINWRARYT